MIVIEIAVELRKTCDRDRKAEAVLCTEQYRQ